MYNILVFPAGTEIGLEIAKSLKFCKDITLFGANLDIPNHAPFVYDNYFTVDKVDENGVWISQLNEIIKKNKIDYIYPGYDDIIVALSNNREKICCEVIVPDSIIASLTRSKKDTYDFFATTDVPVPKTYAIENVVENDFPLFVKPNIGQGSQNAMVVKNIQDLEYYMSSNTDCVIMENLPGSEYTIDCFATKKNGVIYIGGRQRIRCKSGISMSSELIQNSEFEKYANLIYQYLHLQGAWFFQMKYDNMGMLKLLEIAPRVSGTMATNRVRGINFPLLSIYEYAGIDVSLCINNYSVYIDRALENKYKINITYEYIYIDLDDTLVIRDKINYTLIAFLYKSINDQKRIILLTKHEKNDLEQYLSYYRLTNMFDEIICIDKNDNKYKYINANNAIFIDDSFAERLEVKNMKNIHVFDLHMIEALI